MLGERIKQGRLGAGLSLRELADLAGISAMAISKYERDEITPSSDVLLRIAKALNVRVEYFFRQTHLELTDVDFRKHPKLPKKDEERVLADARDQIERWIELESVLPSSWPKAFKVPSDLPPKISSYDEIELVAEKVRQAWELGTNPIQYLMEELELEGIKVIVTPHDGEKKFDGLVAMANGSPVIMVGSDWPGDRQRFTLAHELGHLVLRGRLSPELDEEKACHRFASAFLVPKKEAIRALGTSRTVLEPRELFMLKHEWGLSMNGWLYRTLDLGIINSHTAQKMWGIFRSNGWRTTEPGKPYPQEKTRRFEQLVYRALAEDLVGESKAAELMAMSVVDLRARRRLESTDAPDRH